MGENRPWYLSCSEGFCSGFGSLFDISGSTGFRNIPLKAQQSDADAIAGDWKNVGNYLREASGALIAEKSR